MSVIFGDYRQNGYVVPDLDAAIVHWAQMGVGPFYRLDNLPIVGFKYKNSTISPDLNIALGNFGDVQIELIQPTDSAVSPYRDFLDQRPGGGLHHISVWSENFDADLSTWAEQGLVPDCIGEVGGFARFCYFRSAQNDGTTIEVADVGTSEVFPQLCKLIRESARSWDGHEPSRGPDELFARLAN